MNLLLCYALVYIAEAFILRMYCRKLFVLQISGNASDCLLFFFYLLVFSVSLLHLPGLNILFFFAASLIYIRSCYHLRWHLAAFHTAILTILMCISELLTSLCSSLLTNDIFFQTNSIQSIDFVDLLIICCLSKLLYFFMCSFLAHVLYSGIHVFFSSKIAPPLFLLPVLSFGILSSLLYLRRTLEMNDSLRQILCLNSLLVLLMTLITFYLYDSIQQEDQELLSSQMALQKEALSANYYQKLLDSQEAQRILIHDIRKHLQAIAIMNEHAEHTAIAQYIQEILKEKIPVSLKFCDSDLLNAVLGTYSEKCQQQDIRFHCDIRRNTVNFLSDADLIGLFGNILDNAFTACQRIPSAYIELNVSHHANALVVIRMQNSMNKMNSNKFPDVSGTLQNSKVHGYGLKSVSRIAHKYHGHLETYSSDSDTIFHTIITLESNILP